VEQLPPPTAAAGFAVADDGTTAWLANGVLYGMVANGKIVVLDRGGVIADLRANGTTIRWTHDGAPRSHIPA
jgi:hypothetical protein